MSTTARHYSAPTQSWHCDLRTVYTAIVCVRVCDRMLCAPPLQLLRYDDSDKWLWPSYIGKILYQVNPATQGLMVALNHTLFSILLSHTCLLSLDRPLLLSPFNPFMQKLHKVIYIFRNILSVNVISKELRNGPLQWTLYINSIQSDSGISVKFFNSQKIRQVKTISFN